MTLYLYLKELFPIVGIYFSGTGNTKHCVEEFVAVYDKGCFAHSIEALDIAHILAREDLIVLGYPVYFSNAPKIMQDFITGDPSLFRGKQIFILATMGLFSGDGTGCTARLLKKQGAAVVGGLHLKMPDNIGDEKILKRTREENYRLIRQADKKISAAVQCLKEGHPAQEGLSRFSHLAGLLGQRLWCYPMSAGYKSKPKIDTKKCSGCGQCAQVCPMKNIRIAAGKAVSGKRCTLCYRCFSHCPAKALTILGKRVYEQYLFERLLF